MKKAEISPTCEEKSELSPSLRIFLSRARLGLVLVISVTTIFKILFTVKDFVNKVPQNTAKHIVTKCPL